MPQTISNASFTKLDVFAECRLRAKLQYVDRVPQPAREPPPGKAEHPLDRGIRVHEEGEAYITASDKAELPVEYRKHAEEMAAAKQLHALGQATCEQMWKFDEHWNRLPDDRRWPVYWYVKLDLEFDLASDHKGVVDIKTGKSYYNAIKHTQQVQLYLVATLMRYPKIAKATGELWYVDEGKVSQRFSLTRRQGQALAMQWKQRAAIMTGCRVFPANATKKTCRFCP